MIILKKNNFKVVFIVDLIFIAFIPTIAKIFGRSGSLLDYVIPYFSNMVTLLTIGILIAVYCFKNDK